MGAYTDWIESIERRVRDHFFEGDLVFRMLRYPEHNRNLIIAPPPEMDGPGENPSSADRAARHGNVTYDDVAYNTGNYLTAESFRFATTGTADARQNARRALSGIRLLTSAAGRKGLLVRYAVAKKDLGPQHFLVNKERGFVDTGDYLVHQFISIDQYIHVLCGLARYHRLVADAGEKDDVAADVSALVGYIVDNGMTIPSPRDGLIHFADLRPEGLPENHYATFALGVLALAYLITREERFLAKYRELVEVHNYPARAREGFEGKYTHLWPEPMAFMLYHYLFEIEDDPSVKATYRDLMTAGWKELPDRDKGTDDFAAYPGLVGFDYAALTGDASGAELGRAILRASLNSDGVRKLTHWAMAPFVDGEVSVQCCGVNELWLYWYGRHLGYLGKEFT